MQSRLRGLAGAHGADRAGVESTMRSLRQPLPFALQIIRGHTFGTSGADLTVARESPTTPC